MKISDGFDARRLRPKGPSHWRSRFVLTLAALVTLCGLLMALAGVASVLGGPAALSELNTNPAGVSSGAGHWPANHLAGDLDVAPPSPLHAPAAGAEHVCTFNEKARLRHIRRTRVADLGKLAPLRGG